MSPTGRHTIDTMTGGAVGSVLMVEGSPARLWNPAMVASSAGATGRGAAIGRSAVVAPMHGTILEVLVAEGVEVEAGEPVAILEAMKMETHLAASSSGTVRTVAVRPGDVVEAGQTVVVLG
jgi:biotin carboxyl carrier protein